MLTKPIAVVGLAVGVIAAAGTGAYLAVRQNTAPARPIEVAESAPTALTAVEPAVSSADAMGGEAAPAVVSTPGPAGADMQARGTPSPVTETPDVPPVAAAPPPPGPRPAQTVAPAVPPAAAVTPADAAPVQTAGADLPAVAGWSRPGDADASSSAVAEPPATAQLDPIESLPDPESMLSFVELEIAADSVIGLQVETAVSTRTAEVEDLVEARVTRDVLVADQVAVPAGTRLLGSVVLVERGGRLRDAARLGVRFHTLVMEDSLQIPIVTETIYRDGSSQGSDSVAKIGGAAVGGAILGAIFGGRRGAAVGGSIGAAGGTAAALSGEADPAGLPPGTMLTVRLSQPVTVAVEQ